MGEMADLISNDFDFYDDYDTDDCEYWTTKEGQQILVRDLEQSHLENIVKMLRREQKEVPQNIINEIVIRAIVTK